MPNQPGAALVTGASRGIGRAIAVALARSGRHVIVNYRARRDAAEETLAAVREHATGELLELDVSDPAAVAAAVAELHTRHEALEVLVNNAGIRNDMLMIWMQQDDWRNTLQTNLDAFFHVTRPVLKQMLLQRRGRIINITSAAGEIGSPGQVSYSAAKAGLIGATRSLAREVAKRKITVNAVAPGFIETEMLEGLAVQELRARIPLGRLGKPEEVAALVAFLCSADAAYITGQVFAINGGLY